MWDVGEAGAAWKIKAQILSPKGARCHPPYEDLGYGVRDLCV